MHKSSQTYMYTTWVRTVFMALCAVATTAAQCRNISSYVLCTLASYSRLSFETRIQKYDFSAARLTILLLHLIFIKGKCDYRLESKS